jgi:hypothetical protein
MAKANQATKAKRNRKKLLNFFKRTFSGLKKLANKAAKLPGKTNNAIEKVTASIARAAHSQSKCSPAAAKRRITERTPVTPKQKPCPENRKLAETMPKDTQRLLNGEATAYDICTGTVKRSVGLGCDVAQKEKADRARASLKSVPTKITVPSHERKGTKGVTQHERKTTAKEKNQMAAQRLIDGFNADYGTRNRTNNQWAVQCLSSPDRPQTITAPLDKETAQQIAIDMNKEDFKDGDRYGIKAHDPWKEVEDLSTQPTK